MDAVAGRVDSQINDVSRLLAAEGRTALEHQLQHVFVTDLSAAELDPVVPKLLLEAEIRHDRRHHAGGLQLSVSLEALGPEVDDVVAAPDTAGVVDEDGAVGVAVEGHAEVGTLAHDDVGQRLGVQGSGVLVDVAAVWLVVDDDDVRAGAAEDVGRDTGSGAVTGIERQRHGGTEIVFDLLLDRIGQLHSVMAEDLHAVVFERIVGCGDRDGRHGIGDAAEIGNAGSGDHPDHDWLAAFRADAAGERADDLRPRLAGIAADKDLRLRRRSAEAVYECPAQLVHRRGVERIGVRLPSYAVSAEQNSHACLFSSPSGVVLARQSRRPCRLAAPAGRSRP